MASFWSPDEPKAKLAPRTKESKAGGSWLMDFMKRWGDTTDYPQRQVAGLTPLQQAGQGQLAGYLGQGTEGYNLAMGQTRRTLAGDYDPRTSDFYKGFRQEAEQVRGETSEAIRRRAQAGGMLQSSPYANIEAQASGELDSFMLKKLGEMYERERDRQDTAAGRAADLGQQQFSNLLAGQAMAEAPRLIEQMRNNAMYEEQINELLHAYTNQAAIAMTMMGYSPGVYMQPGVPSGLTKLAGQVKSFSSIAGAVAGLGGGGGGGTAPGGSGTPYYDPGGELTM